MSKVIIEMKVGELQEGLSKLLFLAAKALKPETKIKLGFEIEHEDWQFSDVHIGVAELQQMAVNLQEDLDLMEG